MAFASLTERAALADPVRNTFPLEFTVQYEMPDGRQYELTAEDVDHAIELAANRVFVHGAAWAEVLRVHEDGTTTPTYGKVTADD